MRYVDNPDGSQTRVRYREMEDDYGELAKTRALIKITSGEALDPLLARAREIRELIWKREDDAFQELHQ